MTLANTLSQLHKFDEANLAFERAIQLNPNNPGMYFNRGLLMHKKIGNLYNKNGRHEEAIMLFDKAIKLNPEFTDAYNNKGIDRLI